MNTFNYLRFIENIHMKFSLLHFFLFAERCLFHENQIMIYYCVSCKATVCPECVVSDHTRSSICKVISSCEIPDETSQLREKLTKEISSTKECIESTSKLLKERKETISKFRDDVLPKVSGDCRVLVKVIKERQEQLVIDVNEKERTYLERMRKAKEEVHVLDREVQHVYSTNQSSTDDSLLTLRNIEKEIRKIRDTHKRIDRQKELLKKNASDLFYRKLPNDAVFCGISESTLVGSTGMGSDQLILMYDERRTNGGVRLVCVDPGNSSKLYWEHLEDIEDHVNPVVMSHISMYYERTSHPLFAVDRKIYIVNVHKQGSLYDSVESITSWVIDAVPIGSWITSVTAHFPNNDQNDEFVISTSGVFTLREYNVSGLALRVIETREFVRGTAIWKVAYCKNVFAIIGRGNDDVILINTDGTVKQCGSLIPRPREKGMLPINIIWTGDRWIVLYIKNGPSKSWKVIDYLESLDVMLGESCIAGKFSSENDIPVNITRYRYSGCVTFTNSSVRQFNYNTKDA